MIARNRTSTKHVCNGPYLYFSGLSLRGRLKDYPVFSRYHVSVWDWIQKHNPQKISSKKKVDEFIIDETLLKVGSEFTWLWVATIKPKDKEILALTISKERDMFVAERFISGLAHVY